MDPRACPRCGLPPRPRASFCTGCGSALESHIEIEPISTPAHGTPCPLCGQAGLPSARYCTNCGTLLIPGPRAGTSDSSHEERRTVTVLHADLCGFTRIAERLSPDGIKRVLEPFFDRMTREVTRLGGHVNAYIGDAILAVFGAPIPHRDDPIRAVRAALAMLVAARRFSHPELEALQASFRLRIGIDTGPVIVDRNGDGHRITLAGLPIIHAMELEVAASADTILVSGATRACLGDHRTLEPIVLPNGLTAYRVADDTFAPSLRDSLPAPPGPLPSGNRPRIEVIEPLPTQPTSPRPHPRQPRPGPETRARVHALLSRLNLEQKRLVRLASVAGVHFWVDLLERLGAPAHPQVLAELEARGVVRRVVESTVGDSVEYRFADAAVQQVAYHDQPDRVRRFCHRVVAGWLRECGGGHPALVGLIASHTALGGDLENAVDFLLETVACNVGLEADPANQVVHLTQAMQLLEAHPQDTAAWSSRMARCKKGLEDLGAGKDGAP